METHTVQPGQTIAELIFAIYQLGVGDQTIQCQAVLPNGEAWTCPLTIFEIPGSKDLKGRPMIGIQMRLCDLPCPECGGTGAVDSGGVTPWMAPIDVPCGNCNGSGKVKLP